MIKTKSIYFWLAFYIFGIITVRDNPMDVAKFCDLNRVLVSVITYKSWFVLN